jgi:hypothetical protein
MQIDKTPATLPSVEKLMQRLSAAERSQQKEIRITIQEARELAVELSVLTAKMAKTMQEIHVMLNEIRQSTSQIEVRVDGGGFGQG